jgi:hypothetical protein
MSSGEEKNVVTDREKEKEEAEKAKWIRGINLCFQLIEEHSAKLQPGQTMRLLDVLNDELYVIHLYRCFGKETLP